MELTDRIIQFMQTKQDDFGELALEVFAHQFANCPGYQRYCLQLGASPDSVTYWRDIPSVPTDVLREFELITFPRAEAINEFHTSGTRDSRPGVHLFRSMELYDMAVALSLKKALGLGDDPQPIRVLAPSFEQAPRSSLSYMLQLCVNWYGAEGSRFYWDGEGIDYSALERDLRSDISSGQPILLLGTAFAYLNLFDRYPDELFILPPASRLMETGGLKGRTREISREELYGLFEMRFGLNREHCFSEYGMTELSSQCYSSPDSNFFLPPHWLRVRVIDPSSGKDVPVGEEGVIQFFDLANLDSIAAITTSDRGRRGQIGFEMLGRAKAARLRGCSVVLEDR